MAMDQSDMTYELAVAKAVPVGTTIFDNGTSHDA